MFLRGTSDGNAAKVSEVLRFRGGPPTEIRQKCRRSCVSEGYLRQKGGKSVGGPAFPRGTSDRNTAKVSEVLRFRGGPPTETRQKCRRSCVSEGYLRRKGGKSVGGPVFLRGTSDGNAANVSEVPYSQQIPKRHPRLRPGIFCVSTGGTRTPRRRSTLNSVQ